ncbi:MAG: hypothetical protein OXG36_04695 [Caldilineaceae bacterium]|nr:hypothetical protein [Caldilineaceae bacterium]
MKSHRQVPRTVATCNPDGELLSPEADFVAIQFFTFFRMQASLVNQDRMAASLSASESQTVDNIRPSLKLSAHVRDINTAPLEFNGNRYQQVGTHLAEEQQVVTPFSLNPVIFERFVCVN